MSKITAAILKRQDDVCSNLVLKLLTGNTGFQALATSEGEAIMRRDKEDEEKLQEGIHIAVKKGILPPQPPKTKPVQEINVASLSAQEVAEKILQSLPSKEGNVITIEGFSGTGKGTTVGKLREALPRCVAWSNGNVFRCYTYLCQEILSQQNKPIAAEHLSPELLTQVSSRVKFVEVSPGQFDTLLDDKKVSEIQNTLLKAPVISQNVPTVAQATQGEVINFGTDAIKKLSASGYNVILEGRLQTLQYIPTTFASVLLSLTCVCSGSAVRPSALWRRH
ncbi:hypothetical protein AGDE_08304 [Angomonas deanei]|nr:hypothetical protein AGDE_08304 [Angomonas deanei]|eukprot:EPY33396.1 hypothetical protein AGDE_08304 [Angomonas deanei]